jgi:hypothetical protein
MLYTEIIAVCSEIHTKHINTLCGQNVEFVNVKPGGIGFNPAVHKFSKNEMATWKFHAPYRWKVASSILRALRY